MLYGNKITSLQSRLFEGLTSLQVFNEYYLSLSSSSSSSSSSSPSLSQLLLINANKIECIKADTFASLNSLNLL